MDEFELIDTMVEILGNTAKGPGVVVGPGDDAAVVEVPADHQLVVSTDTLVAGRHFPANAQADVIAYRSMGVATSDLAAMGAKPAYATVALTIEHLSRGLGARCTPKASHARHGTSASSSSAAMSRVGHAASRSRCTATCRGDRPSRAPAHNPATEST